MCKTACLIGQLGAVCLGVVLFTAGPASGAILDDYVARPDACYGYDEPIVQYTGTVDGLPGTYTAYIFNMTSQEWLDSSRVQPVEWRHWLHVVVPSTVTTDKALLFISGRDNDDPAPTEVDPLLPFFSLFTNSVTTYLATVPNQPLLFTGQTEGRREDEIIAYGWDKYLTTEDPNWLVLLPMAKSAVRAMDTVQSFCGDLEPTGVTVNNFVVTGASKRGWTTWLTAAADSRVSAIAPVVIGLLNMEQSFRHHFATYGQWSPAVQDYVDMSIFDWLGTEQLEASRQIIDPYVYLDHYDIPKLLLNASGDEFFVLDSWQYYYNDLPAEKRLRCFPNTGHAMNGTGTGSDSIELTNSLLLFYAAVLADNPMPDFAWSVMHDGSVRVETITPYTPTQVTMWQATNTTNRDFRYPVTGDAWGSSVLADQGGGVYVGQVSDPPAGWTAFFVELQFDSPYPGYAYKFTTGTHVRPDTLPYACDFDQDGDVDLADFTFFVSRWLDDDEWSSADVIPVGGDGAVDISDFARFGHHWLRGT